MHTFRWHALRISTNTHCVACVCTHSPSDALVQLLQPTDQGNTPALSSGVFTWARMWRVLSLTPLGFWQRWTGSGGRAAWLCLAEGSALCTVPTKTLRAFSCDRGGSCRDGQTKADQQMAWHLNIGYGEENQGQTLVVSNSWNICVGPSNTPAAGNGLCLNMTRRSWLLLKSILWKLLLITIVPPVYC